MYLSACGVVVAKVTSSGRAKCSGTQGIIKIEITEKMVDPLELPCALG